MTGQRMLIMISKDGLTRFTLMADMRTPNKRVIRIMITELGAMNALQSMQKKIGHHGITLKPRLVKSLDTELVSLRRRLQSSRSLRLARIPRLLDACGGEGRNVGC